MNRCRFLAVAARVTGPAASRRAAQRLPTGSSGLRRLIDRPHLLLFEEGEAPVIRLEDGQGAILGPLFRRGSVEPVTALTRDEQAELLRSRGSVLTEHFWGGYVAFFAKAAGHSVSVVRAPLGDLPCYLRARGDEILIASDLDLLLGVDAVRAGIDWRSLACHIAVPEIRRRATCLAGVSELQGGNRLTVTRDGQSEEALWTPWRFASSHQSISDPFEARAIVGESVRRSVAGRAALGAGVLLKLSGGLDSSIVAASLEQAGARFACVTLVSADPLGDERAFARLVTAHLGVELHEKSRRLEGIDIMRSQAARLPRPTSRSFTQESTRIAGEVAEEVGADMIFDGGGGDNIFCALRSPAVVADRLRTSGVGIGTWRTAADLSLITGASIATILRRSIARTWLRSPVYRWPIDLSFLSTAARADARHATSHPWLDAPRTSLPGKAAHVALLVGAQSWVESHDPQEIPPLVSPLLAQPVVEACLRVPSWLWLAGGQDRAVARRAFSQDLPSSIVNRRSKGSPDTFVAALFERNVDAIRDMLLGGRLIGAGLLDREALERALADPIPIRDYRFARIMRLVDAEAWVRAQST